jgi:hypothetical protein
MQLDRYLVIADKDFHSYEFESFGRKGTIRKLARFTDLGNNIYNLGFGDLDKGTGEIHDFVNSNNGDAGKVLATLSFIIYQFSEHCTNAMIFVKGSTAAPTRLYQINLNHYWHQIEPLFKVFGFRNGKWEEFTKNINYEAFFAQRKL